VTCLRSKQHGRDHHLWSPCSNLGSKVSGVMKVIMNWGEAKNLKQRNSLSWLLI